MPYTANQIAKKLGITLVTLIRHRTKLGVAGKKKGREVHFSEAQFARLKKSVEKTVKKSKAATRTSGPRGHVAAITKRLATLERILQDHGLWIDGPVEEEAAPEADDVDDGDAT